MQKRVAILGGAGLIGAHLSKRIVERGDILYCIDLRNAGTSKLLRSLESYENFHFVKHNVINPFTIRCDEIYSLCSPSRLNYDLQPPVETLKTHIQGTLNTLENARSEFSRVLYGSSSAVYNSPNAPDFDLRNSKLSTSEGVRAAEMIHRAYYTEYGVDCRIARIFNTYGIGGDINDRHVVMRMIFEALRNHNITIYGNGEQLRTFCWADDVAEALERLMAKEPGNTPYVMDLGGDEELSIRELAEKIIELSGSSSKIVHTSVRLGECRYSRPDLTIARQELKWHPKTSIIEGLKRTIEYVENLLHAMSHGAKSWVEMCC